MAQPLRRFLESVPLFTMGSNCKKTLAFVALLGVALAGLAVSLDDYPAESPDHPEWPYVRKVLLLSETDEYFGFVRRWDRPVRVGVITPDPENHLTTVRAVIEELNTTLSGTGMSLALAQATPDISIIFATSDRLRAAGAERDCEMVANSVAYVCIYGEKSGTLATAVVVISTNEPTVDFYSMVLEEVTQSLGPINDVQDPAFADSLFYEYEEGLSAPYFKVLSLRDRRLLRFLYLHLKPGDRERQVRKAFDRHWLTPQAPAID